MYVRTEIMRTSFEKRCTQEPGADLAGDDVPDEDLTNDAADAGVASVFSNLSNMTCACVVDAACSHGMSAHGIISLHGACVLASFAAMMLCRSHLALLDRRN